MAASAAGLSVTLRSPKPMVMQSKVSSGKGSRSAFAWTYCTLPSDAAVGEPVAPAAQHGGVDVAQHDEAPLAHLPGKARRQVAGAASHIERALARDASRSATA